jgi:hypothetical protein
MYRLTWQLTDGSRGKQDYSTEAAASKPWMRATFSEKVQRVQLYQGKRNYLGVPQWKLLRWANALKGVSNDSRG